MKAIHIGNEIKNLLKAQKRSVNWLAEEICCDNSNLSKQLKTPHLHTVLLYKISEAIGKDLFTLYSQSLYEDEMR